MDSRVRGAYKQRYQSSNLHFLDAIGEGIFLQENNALATPSLLPR